VRSRSICLDSDKRYRFLPLVSGRLESHCWVQTHSNYGVFHPFRMAPPPCCPFCAGLPQPKIWLRLSPISSARVGNRVSVHCPRPVPYLALFLRPSIAHLGRSYFRPRDGSLAVPPAHVRGDPPLGPFVPFRFESSL